MEALLIAERLISALSPWFDIEGQKENTITASIGISLPTAVTSEPEQLLENADQAMYEAKARGGGSFHVLDDILRERVAYQPRRPN